MSILTSLRSALALLSSCTLVLLLSTPLGSPPATAAVAASTAEQADAALTSAVQAGAVQVSAAQVRAGTLRTSTGTGAESPAHPTTWLSPVPGLRVVRGFDPPAQNWLSGHRGADVAALVGEEVRAPAAGTVRFAGAVAGKPVLSIEASGWVMSMENVDASVDAGDAVHPGQPVGTVADPPHCPDGCVHVGVRRSGENDRYLDPLAFFGGDDAVLLPSADAPEELPALPPDAQRSGAGPWGGHRNGRIPQVAMCPLSAAPGQVLRCDAARAFDALSSAFAARFGAPVSVTDAYRTYETQVVLKRRKGRMAATPGTSNHGWGLAVDLGSGINRFGTEQHTWMRQNAPRFGWIHPAWARQDGSLPEAWHWEYSGAAL
jgi:hypothetical protein